VLTYDVHQHLWPASFVSALRARGTVPFVRDDELVTPEGAFGFDARAHDPETRLALLDRDGIGVAVLSLQPTLGIEALPAGERDHLEETWLAGMCELVAQSGGRFRALAPWRIAEGFTGVSVGASALIGPGRGADALAEADASGTLVFVHPESEGALPAGRPAWWNWTAGYTGQMQRAYLAWLGGGRDAHPSVPIVFAQLAGGAPIHHERLVHRGVHVRGTLDPLTLFETSTYGRRAIELCIETFGVERLVYGSDAPVVDPRPTLRAVQGLGDSVAHILQSDTPGRLLS
jgi:hypothetical protein